MSIDLTPLLDIR